MRTLIDAYNQDKPGIRKRFLGASVLIAVHSALFVAIDALSRSHYVSVKIPLDDIVPFVPIFVVPYLLWYLPFVFAPYVVAVLDGTVFRRMMITWIASLVFAVACFLLFPTQMERQALDMPPLLNPLFRLIWAMDPGRCLLPSLHILIAWLHLLSLNALKGRIPRPWLISANVLLALIIPSVVLIRQHYLLDIPSAAIAVQLAWSLSGLAMSRRAPKGEKG